MNGMCRSQRSLPIRCATDNDDLYKIVKIRKRTIPKDRSMTICVHVLRECVDLDDIQVSFVPGRVNPADALTKPLSDMSPLLKIMTGEVANMGQDLDPISKKR